MSLRGRWAPEVVRAEAKDLPIRPQHHQPPATATALVFEDDRPTPTAPGGEDVPRAESVQPGGDRAAPNRIAALGLARVQQRPIRLDVAAVAASRFLEFGELAFGPGQLALQADDVAVGAVLGEREVQESVGGLGFVPGDEVRGHVVVGAE